MGKWKYGIILDAGSSGTRIYIYRWLNAHRAREGASDKELHSLPELETRKEWIDKIHPGIATFGDKPELVGPDHLKELFDLALDVVPKDEVEQTPIFLLATAGMRLLEATKRRMLLDQVCKYARTTTKFQIPDCDLHIQVIPGETEGLYGWIAANYLLGGFDNPKSHDHGKGHHTYGFLDMGGASAQIAFAPNATEADKHANDLQLLRLRKINGEQSEYRVFVTTWLEFGVNEARRRYVEALREASPSEKELPDPCLPAGLVVTAKGELVGAKDEAEASSPHLIGTGKFDECMRQTYPLLDKDAPCPDTPCLLHGVHVPAIDFDVNHFVGVSEYWHTTHEIFEMSYKGKGYDFKTYQKIVSAFCSQPWKEIEEEVQNKKWGKKVKAKTAQEACFKASWLINVLHDGIGVPRVGIESHDNVHNGTDAALDKAKQKGYLNPFQAVDKINGVEVSWTLGKMVLYAASQIPPTNDALAVGFGSNAVGASLPSDFQHAGGTPIPIDTTDHGEDNDGDWHDTLFQDSPRRIPGFLIFLLIVLVALFIICGRDRRNGMVQRFRRAFGLSSVPSRKRRFGGIAGTVGKLFRGHSGPSYERVLEDGDAVNDFELPEVDSDNDHSDSSSGSSRVGRTSGWATPQTKTGFELTPAYVDSHNIIQQGAGLGLLPPTAIDRGGLMSRTDSRERLAAEREKRNKSRNGSPTRMRSTMMGLKESVE